MNRARIYPSNDVNLPFVNGPANVRERSLLEKRRRRMVFAGVLALLLVGIVAIALGTSLGRKKTKGDDGETSTTIAHRTTAPTKAPRTTPPIPEPHTNDSVSTSENEYWNENTTTTISSTTIRKNSTYDPEKSFTKSNESYTDSSGSNNIIQTDGTDNPIDENELSTTDDFTRHSDTMITTTSIIDPEITEDLSKSTVTNDLTTTTSSSTTTRIDNDLTKTKNSDSTTTTTIISTERDQHSTMSNNLTAMTDDLKKVSNSASASDDVSTVTSVSQMTSDDKTAKSTIQ